MPITEEEVGHADLVDGGETALHSHSGGSSPRIFYAVNTGTSGLGTSLTTVDFEDVQIMDSGYSESGGEVTILTAGRYEISSQVMCSGASNRVEIVMELQVNGGKVKGACNYSARNSTQDRGGANILPHIATLSVNDVVRVQSQKSGSNAYKIAGDCSLLIGSL